MGTTDPVAESKKVFNTKVQPNFHEGNKSLLEKLACCCVVDKDLTHIENKRYQQFVWEFVKSYDEENPRHEATLKTLFDQVLDDEARENADERMKTDKWTEIGFQSTNPRTDFRGGGILSLLCLIYFSSEFKEQFELMKQSYKEKEDFFLAISSINLTSFMQSYFYMN